MTYAQVRGVWTAARERAGVGRVTIHQLRHTFATTLLRGGASILTVQRLLGHVHLESTLRYAQVSNSLVFDDVAAVARRLKEGVQGYRPDVELLAAAWPRRAGAR